MEKVNYEEKSLLELIEIMENLKKEQLEVISLVNELKLDEKVKKYMEQQGVLDEISEKIVKLTLTEIPKKRMLECRHIWVKTYENTFYDGHRYETAEHHTCVRCGLDTRLVELYELYPKQASEEEKIMALVYPRNRRGLVINQYCDKDVAISLYKNIIRAFPQISDEELVNHFKVSLESMEKSGDIPKKKLVP